MFSNSNLESLRKSPLLETGNKFLWNSCDCPERWSISSNLLSPSVQRHETIEESLQLQEIQLLPKRSRKPVTCFI